jgi:hypothetical protein
MYGPSVMMTLPSGCARSDFALLAGCRPPTKILTPSSLHLVVKRVDIAFHCFVLERRVVVVWVVISNQILGHDFLLFPVTVFGGGPVCLPLLSRRTAGFEFDKLSKKNSFIRDLDSFLETGFRKLPDPVSEEPTFQASIRAYSTLNPAASRHLLRTDRRSRSAEILARLDDES